MLMYKLVWCCAFLLFRLIIECVLPGVKKEENEKKDAIPSGIAREELKNS